MQPQTAPAPSPNLFFDTLNAYQRTAALKCAVELDLFTAIGEGNQTANAIAQRCHASERGTRILCDYLTILGFLSKRSGEYALTPDSAMFLDRRSRAYLGGAVQFLAHPIHQETFSNLAAVVRKGGALDQGHIDVEENAWVEFARGMAPIVFPSAEKIASLLNASDQRPLRVLDIAAGHGMFGILIAQQNKNAHITAVDLPPVLNIAREHAQQFGVADRYRTIPGDFFAADLGAGYDVALITNFLHHFDQATCVGILKKVRAALNPDGVALTAEFVPNEDRISPPIPAAFSLTMLAGTPGGDAYTFKELEAMFRQAGFASSAIHSVGPAFPQSILLSR